MLKAVRDFRTPSVERLLKLWQQRYTHDLSPLLQRNILDYNSLIDADSPEGRNLTVKKLQDKILNANCQTGWMYTEKLYDYIPNVLDINEASRITEFSFRIYRKLLGIYEKQSLVNYSSGLEPPPEKRLTCVGIPEIDSLAYSLEPILLIYQEQHIASGDWRCLGFMTTHLNFTNQLILKELEASEKLLISPYLKFLEEHVVMPWHRVCVAAAKHEINTPQLNLLEKILPAAPQIAKSVYRKLIELLPDIRSRRGTLTEVGVIHSSLRDLNMFQAYILLCCLESSLKSIERELLPLCIAVVEAVGIDWKLTEKWCDVLASELENYVTPEEKVLLEPYTQGMKALFLRKRYSLGFRGESKSAPVSFNLSFTP
ncbi:MAG: hypothetical protein QNJ49_05635 [Mastigocoleus sp. MO_167.B18]|uniref:hypothetical protein n=1 Tax=Mastigocoleus sp. MO_188.B34 TaxID=3036635 RepID=UPI0026066037|nr:hypothetical protein [Mastigocoleus sp. MO_188.B34]MDJ0693896.1 hypothetical protein [Mastigocoleus sp. MO_188.B34]MDJ0772899.1 hypothetical protein [Mastigocoleus sp. MO_167.B18]